MNFLMSISILVILIGLIVWFFQVLKKAVEIKAIQGTKDKIIIAILWLLGIIFAILYLQIKIEKKKNAKEPEPQITKKEIKNIWDKFIFIVWKDDSPKGWLISLALIFILIKFLFFPVLSFVTGTTLPLAIVESCSMHHDGNYISNFDSWWNSRESLYEEFNITKTQFEEFHFTNGFTKGDILLILGADAEKLEVGDIIIFNVGKTNPLIHRIVQINETSEGKIFSTLGDNNAGQLDAEKQITEEQLVGKATPVRVPYLGWVKLIFFEHLQPPYNKGFC